MDLTATDCAELSGVAVRLINDIYLRVHHWLGEHYQTISPLGGELGADEPYFGPRRVRGLRGRGAGGKTVFLGLLKRGDSAYTKIVQDATKRTVQTIIRRRADIANVFHTDGWRGYGGLVDAGFDKHLRLNHGSNEFARGPVRINGIESFWGYAKRRLVKFNGVPRHTFYLHFKETK